MAAGAGFLDRPHNIPARKPVVNASAIVSTQAATIVHHCRGLKEKSCDIVQRSEPNP